MGLGKGWWSRRHHAPLLPCTHVQHTQPDTQRHMHTYFQGCRQRVGNWLPIRTPLKRHQVSELLGCTQAWSQKAMLNQRPTWPGGRWGLNQSSVPQTWGNRLLLLRTRILGKSCSGGKDDKGSWGKALGVGKGDDACLRICLGGNEMEHLWGYSSSSLEELLITPVSATINSETNGKV